MTEHDQYREDLPLYAVGALTKEESERMKSHLAECSACSEELRSLNEAAAQIALAIEPATPNKHLKESLLSRLEGQRSEPLRSTRKARPQRVWFWAPALAAAVLVIVLGMLWQHNRGLLRENRELTANLKTDELLLHRSQVLIDTLTAADAQRVTLVAAGTKPRPEASAIYSPKARSLVLLAANLNPLPSRKTYELWLLPASGSKPIPAGTFQPDARGSATLVLSQFGGGVVAKGFAMTIENKPGSATPTMPIILSGTI